VDVAEIAPRLWCWTGRHEEWEEDVGSVYYETGDGVVLVDPIVPPEDEERFLAQLDREVSGQQVHVLVTVFWHTRSASALVERYGARVWAPARGKAAIARRAGVVTDPFKPGDDLPGDLQALPTARAAEVVYWIPRHGALVPGDVLLGEGAKGGGTRRAGPGGIRMCPESWLPEGKGHAELAASLRPLLDLPVERILVSHGAPVLEHARESLSIALDVA
jgi:glyoxylase-like metal-dependent hydrolase (beta-lactamase superfamily II)